MSTHADFRDRVKTAIAALTLTGLSSSNVVTRKVPVDRGLTLPGIVVCAYGQELIKRTGNAYQTYGYPVAVVIHEVSNQVATADDTSLTWRQQIRNAFAMKGGSIVQGAELCEVEFGPVIDMAAWQNANLALSFLTIRCWARYVKGS